MGARDGATQAAIQHMIYDEWCLSNAVIYLLYKRRQDHKLILGTHNKWVHFCSLDRRPRDGLNGKNVEVVAAAAAPSCCCMT